MLDAWTLEDSRQGPESVPERLVAWLGEARAGLDLALYDVRLPGPVGDVVAGALREAIARGVRVRIAYNDEDPGPDERPFQPPPPSTQPHLLEQLGAQLRGIPGWRDLMHPGGFAPLRPPLRRRPTPQLQKPARARRTCSRRSPTRR
ncbi:MAG TPA: hypothetical protein VI006_11380 [Solirubrobacteraceae bacterium]